MQFTIMVNKMIRSYPALFAIEKEKIAFNHKRERRISGLTVDDFETLARDENHKIPKSHYQPNNLRSQMLNM